MKYSNEGVPSHLIEFLKESENFEVWFYDEDLGSNYNFESEYIDFQANKKVFNLTERLKSQLLTTLFQDFEKGGEASRCWIPHHGIRAIYNEQLIEIAVCFMCGWFRGQISEERFYGTFPNEEESQSKAIFDEVFNL